jgi:hypothetical protein
VAQGFFDVDRAVGELGGGPGARGAERSRRAGFRAATMASRRLRAVL